MSFLAPMYEKRETSGNLPESPAVIDDSQQPQLSQPQNPSPSPSPSPTTRPESSTPPPARPVKRNPKRKSEHISSSEVDEEILKNLRKPDDEDELWALGLLPSIRRLGYLEKMEFRTEVQSLLIKYLRAGETTNPMTFATPRPGPSQEAYTTYVSYQSEWPQETNHTNHSY